MKYVQFLSCAATLLSMSAFAADAANGATTPMCQNQGEPLTCYSAGYNAPAIINVKGKPQKMRSGNVNMFVDASFTYWFAGEDGLKIASSGVYESGTTYFAQDTKTLTQSFGYKPGFKIGTGVVGYQEWTVLAEYTYFRGHYTKNSGAALTGTALPAGSLTVTPGTSVWLVDDWFLQGTTAGQALAGSQVSSEWKLGLDLIDLVAGRPFYQGKCMTVSPFGGLRSALIRQSMEIELTEVTDLFGAMPTQPIEAVTNSHSWSIGPIGGCQAKSLFPMGFRLEADAAAALLYTQYTSVKHSEDAASTGFNPGPYTASLKNYNCLRPMAEMGLGLGWGMYLCDNNYHIDFMASYDFKMFWSQNMMRKLMDDTLTGTSASPGDLYLHGLTITGRFDF
jgi:hypothetical protein